MAAPGMALSGASAPPTTLPTTLPPRLPPCLPPYRPPIACLLTMTVTTTPLPYNARQNLVPAHSPRLPSRRTKETRTVASVHLEFVSCACYRGHHNPRAHTEPIPSRKRDSHIRSSRQSERKCDNSHWPDVAANELPQSVLVPAAAYTAL